MTSKRPLVSIIMGTFNCASSLHTCIDSIINQSYTNWELIICDDCSTDETLLIASKYDEKFENIRLIRNKENMKLAYSLNHCLKYAKGKYIARMDADDICFSDRLEKQVDFLENNPKIDVVGTAVIPFDENGDKPIRFACENPNVRILTHRTTFFHPTVMMKKTCYDHLGGYTVAKRTQKGQDIDLWFRFFAEGYTGENLKEPLIKYHESISDYQKKRNIRFAIGIMQTKFYGYRINNFQWYIYPTAVKPVIAAMIPKKIIHIYHNRRKGNK